MIDCDLTWVAIPHKLVVALVFDGVNNEQKRQVNLLLLCLKSLI